jgi:hypothetical protein
MTSALLAFLIKLPLALFVFLLIAYAGIVNRRVAGVLFTFPILNGVAIIASHDPVTVADAIYPLVIFNCVLFALLISFPRVLPPVSALPRATRLLARVATWAIVWFAGAYWLTDFRGAISGAGVLFAGSAIFAILFMAVFWTRTPQLNTNGGAGRVNLAGHHWSGFRTFWLNRTGAGRIVFFTLAYAALFFVSRVALHEKWVGMASALPLPGFFALASLIDDAEDNTAALASLKQIRDTLFLGPVLVIPFNWTLSHLLASVIPPDAIALRYGVLFALWTVAASAVLLVVPRLSAWFQHYQRA